jgi:small-conductance mechanosensitive channel
VLVAVFGVGVVLGYALVELTVRASGFAPRVGWSSVVGLLCIVALVGGLALSTYRAVHRDRRLIASRHAVNLLVLAKASALAGAVMSGGYVGFALPFLHQLDVVLPRERVIRSGAAALCALALVVCGLLLERACRVPKIEDE